jgi:hypothetical protein
MMSNKRNPTNFSGLDIQGLDVDVRQTLLQGAVPNKSALTAKQRWDRKRKRRTFDLNPEVIEALRVIAEEERISMSRLANFLLARAILLYFQAPDFARTLEESKRPVYTSQFDWVPVAPEAWLQRIRAHLDALKRRKNWGVK